MGAYMKEIINDGNIFLLPKVSSDACLVMTNGVVKKNGCAVMGTGIAKWCRDTFGGIDRVLGGCLMQGGNHVHNLGQWSLDIGGMTFWVFSFPTKDDWKNDSSAVLIRRSCEEMVRLADSRGLSNIYMPCPGCRNGHLDYWRDVRRILEEVLDDRFTVNVPSDIAAKRPRQQ